MTIHIVMGPPCAGKTTYVEQHAAPGTPRFDFDKVADAIAGMATNHDPSQDVLNVVMAMRRGLIGWSTDPEESPPELWIIHANPAPALIARFVAVAAEFHLVDPGMETCLERAAAEDWPAHTEERIRAWYQAPPQVPEEKGGEAMKKKFVDVQVKSLEETGESTGRMEAYASVFNTIDQAGDVVLPGAFTNSLKAWAEKGTPIPLLYGHDFSDPFSNIGVVTDAIEDEHGLKVTAEFDLENPKAAQVYKLVKSKRINQMSFAYRVKDGSWGEREGREVYELKELDLLEVSVVPLGCNPDTEILDVKAWDSMTTEEQKAMARKAAPLLRYITELLESLPDSDTTETNTSKGTKPEEVSSSAGTQSAESIKGRANALMARFLLLEKENH